jgi:hypothetical protein
MPFDAAFDDVYKLGVKETCERLKISAERVDEQIFHGQNILDRIYSQIETADFIIADMTGRNPNVFYEVGYAHAKGKICLLLTSDADDIPFDLKHHRHIIYGKSIQNLRQSLEKDLAAVKLEVINRQSVVSVELTRASGDLEKTQFSATGKVNLFFELKNTTNISSPEIEAIYFCTGEGWRFEQDGQECLSSKNSGAEIPLQHFVKSPVRKLSAGAWAQVKISGSKMLAATWKGNTLKDEYHLSGKALIRIVTSEGPFDFPIEIDVECNELPF